MNEQITKLQAELSELGIVGRLAADLEEMEFCIEIAQQCQTKIKELMDLGVTTGERGILLSDLYEQGERLLKKHTN